MRSISFGVQARKLLATKIGKKKMVERRYQCLLFPSPPPLPFSSSSSFPPPPFPLLLSVVSFPASLYLSVCFCLSISHNLFIYVTLDPPLLICCPVSLRRAHIVHIVWVLMNALNEVFKILSIFQFPAGVSLIYTVRNVRDFRGLRLVVGGELGERGLMAKKGKHHQDRVRKKKRGLLFYLTAPKRKYLCFYPSTSLNITPSSFSTHTHTHTMVVTHTPSRSLTHALSCIQNEPVYFSIHNQNAHTDRHAQMYKCFYTRMRLLRSSFYTSFFLFLFLSLHFIAICACFQTRPTSTNRTLKKSHFQEPKCMPQSISTQFPVCSLLLVKVPVNILIGLTVRRYIYPPYRHQHCPAPLFPAALSLSLSLSRARARALSHYNRSIDNNRNGIWNATSRKTSIRIDLYLNC